MADLDTLNEDVEESTPTETEDDFSRWEEEMTENTGEEDPDELEHKRDNSEKAKIGLPETIIFTLLALFADAVEFLGASANILPVIGQAIWFFTWIFGLIVSLIILLWTFIRGVHGRSAIKIAVARIVGFLLDSALIGWLPIRTVVLIVTIWLNNHLENKEIDRVVSLLSKIKP